MNRAYKLVWNAVSNRWVVASELAKGKKKSKATSLVAAIALIGGLSTGVVHAAPAANALPTGESVSSGSATFDRTITNQLTVNQSSGKLITDWNSFDVGSNGKVVFAQPNASSIALNRVSNGSITEIFGQLSANGQLVIVNPNGITFGAGSQVSAASLIGSVLDINDTDFNNGNLLFNRGSSTAAINNQGVLKATAGSVSLLAPTVNNSGSITSTAGNVSLINADAVNLSGADASIITVSSITGLVKNSGSIQATQVSAVGGRILLQGDSSQSASAVELNGTLNAASDTTITASQIKVAGILDIDGDNNILKLNSTTPYSLGSGSSINLNGSNNGFSVNGTAYTVIRDVSQLQAMNNNLSGSYVLAGDIDASDTLNWNSGAGFVPVGKDGVNFTGALDGLGHVLDSLYINRPQGSSVGLFGSAAGASLKNIGLSNVNITGGSYVGSLAGSSSATISNSYATGSVTGSNGDVGGLLGLNYYGTISSSYATVSVTGSGNNVGGLVGSNSGTISNSYATGSVSGASNVGGLTGYNIYSTITNSYATGSVTASSGNAGGLAGFNNGSSPLSNSYATGRVTASGSNAGGLVGYNYSSPISNSYWDVDTTGQSAGVAGNNGGTLTNVVAVYGNSSTSPSAYKQSSYANFDFGNTWFMVEGSSRPMLRAFLNKADSDGNIAIGNLYQLQGMAANLAGNYYLTQDINASATAASVTAGNAGTRSDVWGGRGFASIGNNSTGTAASRFTGLLDGKGYAVDGLSINRPSTDYIGLISYNYGGTIQNIGLTNVNITGSENVGGLAGISLYGAVSNSYVTGSVSGNTKVGGLVGYNVHSAIRDSYATGSVTGSVNSTGGLAGYNFNSSISGSYATGSVSGSAYVGGLVGTNEGPSTITNSYASGSVSGTVLVGGLAGSNGYGSSITNSYASGSVNASSEAGGLVGMNIQSTITNSYASGSVNANSDVGGLIGMNIQTTVVNSYWNTSSTGQASAIGSIEDDNTLVNLVGLTNAQSTQLSSFANWGSNIDAQGGTGSIWRIYDGQSGPLLRSFLKPLSITVNNNVTKTYDATSYSGGTLDYTINDTYDGSKLLGSATLAGSAIGARNAGSYTFDVGGLYSGQTGYDLVVNGGTLTINKRLLTITAQADSKIYDGKLTASATGKPVVVGRQRGDSIAGLTQSYLDKNAGTGKTIAVDAGYTIRDGNGGNNYDVVLVNNTSGIITPKALTIGTVANTKVYDGGVTSANKPVVTGLITGDRVTGLFQQYETKTVGTGKKLLVKSGYVVNDGNGGNNYSVTEQGSMDGVITAN